MKENQFHGEYYSPGQGKRPDQYQNSMKGFGIVMIGILVFIVVVALIEIIKNL